MQLQLERFRDFTGCGMEKTTLVLVRILDKERLSGEHPRKRSISKIIDKGAVP
jgi:hypothetical protein